MKTELMAVAASCWSKALAAGRAWSEERRKVNLRLLAAFVALSFLAPFFLGEAEAACPPSKRIKHSDSTCIHAWWDNSPSSSCWGTKGGARSYCHDYGTVKVNIDLIEENDMWMTLTNGNKERYRRCYKDTRQISCCLDTSDLCEKQEVEPVDNRIKYYTTTPKSKNAYLYARVDTHEARYNHCKDWPNTIYCENDPSGDAFTKPLLCDGSLCTVDHCWDGWNESRASNSCDDESMTLRDGDVFRPRCRVSATCPDDDGVPQVDTVTYDMDTMPTLKNCDGDIRFWSCSRP